VKGASSEEAAGLLSGKFSDGSWLKEGAKERG